MPESVEIKEIKYGSDEYRKSLDLRNRILRKPIGLNLFDENLEKESEDIHIGVFKSGVIIGISILTEKNSDTVQMRQVAVEEEYRGQGTGRVMVLFSENIAHERGYSKIILHARETAVGFYEKLQYVIAGDLFYEVGIPHLEMYKLLLLKDQEFGDFRSLK